MYKEYKITRFGQYLILIRYLIKNSKFFYFCQIFILIIKFKKNNWDSKVNFIKYNVHVEINIYVFLE
ncbi:hypothetical protein DB299_04935 (plasmid) [Borreliella bavariensis PBi]|uniref:Uncharacterized protein n=1 Tax=Borrelia garinii subsp. bavariensis (strain ATCC BAA-2496 / DSM 23469 / PBi) TaxID=290434 RepID=A0ABN5RFE0_BORGP|nr:hypothetical protein DB299_04935 [Borreliella bavariensis PBi]